jgi:rhodanese-related sulfurtransferase
VVSQPSFPCSLQEVISTGGLIPPPLPGSGVVTGVHLSPSEFHSALEAADPANSVLIDVRCPKEFAIGHFDRAIDPKIRTFAEWPKFVKDNLDDMKGKKVFMYCTGGIRCEKASAFMKSCGLEEIYQLKGGIHRYLETVREVLAAIFPCCVSVLFVCCAAVHGRRSFQGQELCV